MRETCWQVSLARCKVCTTESGLFRLEGAEVGLGFALLKELEPVYGLGGGSTVFLDFWLVIFELALRLIGALFGLSIQGGFTGFRLSGEGGVSLIEFASDGLLWKDPSLLKVRLSVRVSSKGSSIPSLFSALVMIGGFVFNSVITSDSTTSLALIPSHIGCSGKSSMILVISLSNKLSTCSDPTTEFAMILRSTAHANTLTCSERSGFKSRPKGTTKSWSEFAMKSLTSGVRDRLGFEEFTSRLLPVFFLCCMVTSAYKSSNVGVVARCKLKTSLGTLLFKFSTGLMLRPWATDLMEFSILISSTGETGFSKSSSRAPPPSSFSFSFSITALSRASRSSCLAATASAAITWIFFAAENNRSLTGLHLKRAALFKRLSLFTTRSALPTNFSSSGNAAPITFFQLWDMFGFSSSTCSATISTWCSCRVVFSFWSTEVSSSFSDTSEEDAEISSSWSLLGDWGILFGFLLR